MSDPAETLIDLLNGDVVRLETAELAVEARVVDHERERPPELPEDGTWCYTIHFMPVGEDALDNTADRYRVTVDPDERGGWTVGELLAEVYVEEELDYTAEPRGELVDVELLDTP